MHQGVGNNGVQHHIGAGHALAAAQRTELEFIARKGEGRGAVAVGGILGKLGQNVHAQPHLIPLVALILGGVNDGLDDLIEFVAQKHGNDGRRGLVSAQTVIVARVGHCDSKQILIIVHRRQNSGQEQKELGVLAGGFAGFQQVHARIGGQGIVIVLAAAVDPAEGLFVQQTHHAVAVSHLLHDLHGELVMVSGDIHRAENGGQLMLRGSDFVMLGLDQHAQLPEFFVQLPHKGVDPRLDRAKEMIVQFLPLWRLGPVQGAAGDDQVGPFEIKGFVDQKIFLLGAHGGIDPHGGLIAEQTQNAKGLLIQGLHGTQQRRFFVQRLPAVGAVRRGNIQGLVLHKSIAGGIPRCIAPRLKGGTQSARRERAGVRLAADQLLAAELTQHLAVFRRADEGIVLFGGHAGHGLEPVRIMGRALFQRPVLHGVGDHPRQAGIQRTAFFNGPPERFIGFLGQAVLHDRIVKAVFAEDHAGILHPLLPPWNAHPRKHNTLHG